MPLWCVAQSPGAGIELDFLMHSDPHLQVPEPVMAMDPNLTALWVMALERPEIDMQRMAAETIARAHRRGIPDLIKSVPRLEEIVVDEASHPAARFAAARALIVLESRRSGDILLQASQQYGADLRQLVEPALATWESSKATSIWIERIRAAGPGRRDLILAFRGLGAVREQSALPVLLSITSDVWHNPVIRMEAATSAGRIAETGLEQNAAQLAEDTTSLQFVNQLCACRLLAHHTSRPAQQLLIELASHDEATVAAAALQRLNDIDSSLVLPLAESAIQHSDPLVRRQGMICMLQRPVVSHVAPLSGLLADPNPGLRHEVCEGLFRLAKEAEFGEAIREAAQQVLMGDGWQGQEQAAMLLGALEHQPAAGRLIELLHAPRVEVRLSSAWALRKVAAPETIPALIDHARLLTERRRSEDQPKLDEQVALLFEALGVLQADDAEPLLLEYVPKRINRNDLSRGAAIWALGRLYAGHSNPEIGEALIARVLDAEPQPFEISLVKQMSAIALGRMQADDQASTLRQLAISSDTNSTPSASSDSSLRLALALRWAVRELTGEELPRPQPLTVSHTGWFLEPVK